MKISLISILATLGLVFFEPTSARASCKDAFGSWNVNRESPYQDIAQIIKTHPKTISIIVSGPEFRAGGSQVEKLQMHLNLLREHGYLILYMADPASAAQFESVRQSGHAFGISYLQTEEPNIFFIESSNERSALFATTKEFAFNITTLAKITSNLGPAPIELPTNVEVVESSDKDDMFGLRRIRAEHAFDDIYALLQQTEKTITIQIIGEDFYAGGSKVEKLKALLDRLRQQGYLIFYMSGSSSAVAFESVIESGHALGIGSYETDQKNTFKLENTSQITKIFVGASRIFFDLPGLEKFVGDLKDDHKVADRPAMLEEFQGDIVEKIKPPTSAVLKDGTEQEMSDQIDELVKSRKSISLIFGNEVDSVRGWAPGRAMADALPAIIAELVKQDYLIFYYADAPTASLFTEASRNGQAIGFSGIRPSLVDNVYLVESVSNRIKLFKKAGKVVVSTDSHMFSDLAISKGLDFVLDPIGFKPKLKDGVVVAAAELLSALGEGKDVPLLQPEGSSVFEEAQKLISFKPRTISIALGHVDHGGARDQAELEDFLNLLVKGNYVIFYDADSVFAPVFEKSSGRTIGLSTGRSDPASNVYMVSDRERSQIFQLTGYVVAAADSRFYIDGYWNKDTLLLDPIKRFSWPKCTKTSFPSLTSVFSRMHPALSKGVQTKPSEEKAIVVKKIVPKEKKVAKEEVISPKRLTAEQQDVLNIVLDPNTTERHQQDYLTYKFLREVINGRSKTFGFAIGNPFSSTESEKVSFLTDALANLRDDGWTVIYDADSSMADTFANVANGGMVGVSATKHDIANNVYRITNPYLRMRLLSLPSRVAVSTDSITGTGLIVAGAVNYILTPSGKWTNGFAKWSSQASLIRDSGRTEISLLTDNNFKKPRTIDVRPFPNAEAFLTERRSFLLSYDQILNSKQFQTTFENAYKTAAKDKQTGAVVPQGAVCFASGRNLDEYVQLVYDVGYFLGENGIPFTSGGAGGFMEVGNAGSYDAGGYSTGIPLGRFLASEKYASVSNQTHTISSGDYDSRIPLLLADRYLIIVAPGGPGTMKELAATLVMLGADSTHQKHIVFLGSGYYGDLFKWLKKDQKFPRKFLSRLHLIDKAEDLTPVLEKIRVANGFVSEHFSTPELPSPRRETRRTADDFNPLGSKSRSPDDEREWRKIW